MSKKEWQQIGAVGLGEAERMPLSRWTDRKRDPDREADLVELLSVMPVQLPDDEALTADPVEASFLADLDRDPFDETVRFVYADWLDEQKEGLGAKQRWVASKIVIGKKLAGTRRLPRLQEEAFAAECVDRRLLEWRYDTEYMGEYLSESRFGELLVTGPE